MSVWLGLWEHCSYWNIHLYIWFFSYFSVCVCVCVTVSLYIYIFCCLLSSVVTAVSDRKQQMLNKTQGELIRHWKQENSTVLRLSKRRQVIIGGSVEKNTCIQVACLEEDREKLRCRRCKCCDGLRGLSKITNSNGGSIRFIVSEAVWTALSACLCSNTSALNSLLNKQLNSAILLCRFFPPFQWWSQ